MYFNPKCICTNKRILNLIKQKLIELKKEIDKLTILVEDFSITCSVTKRKYTESKDIKDLKNTTKQPDLMTL